MEEIINMLSAIKIALLHLCILAAQSFYMYLSSKAQMKRRIYLYLAAIPVVMCFPAIISSQDPAAQTVYEYALVFCIMTAAVVDVMISSYRNRDYMTEHSWFRYMCAYLLICTAVVWGGHIGIAVRLIVMVILIAAFVYGFITKRLTAKDILKSALLAAISLACSWAFVDWLM
jgi:hypothetical protein